MFIHLKNLNFLFLTAFLFEKDMTVLLFVYYYLDPVSRISILLYLRIFFASQKIFFFLNVLFYYPFFIIVLFEYTLFSKRVALSFSSTFFLLPRDLNFNLEICWSKYFVTFLSLYRFPFLFKNAVCVYIYIYQLDVSFNL